jgi:hypothetical protein
VAVAAAVAAVVQAAVAIRHQPVACGLPVVTGERLAVVAYVWPTQQGQSPAPAAC